MTVPKLFALPFILLIEPLSGKAHGFNLKQNKVLNHFNFEFVCLHIHTKLKEHTVSHPEKLTHFDILKKLLPFVFLLSSLHFSQSHGKGKH